MSRFFFVADNCFFYLIIFQRHFVIASPIRARLSGLRHEESLNAFDSERFLVHGLGTLLVSAKQ